MDKVSSFGKTELGLFAIPTLAGNAKPDSFKLDEPENMERENDTAYANSCKSTEGNS